MCSTTVKGSDFVGVEQNGYQIKLCHLLKLCDKLLNYNFAKPLFANN